MTDLADYAGTLGLRGLTWFFNRLSLEQSLAIGKWAGKIVFSCHRRRREAYADLKAALSRDLSEPERKKILRRLSEHFGQMFVEVLRSSTFDRSELKKHVHFHHWERCEPGLDGTRGLIFLTAHLGNWELMQFIPGNLGKPIHILAQKQKHPRMNQYLNEIREARGETIAISQGMGVRGLLKVLYQNGIIGLLGDRTAGKQDGIILPFLGRKTSVPTGAFELARRSEALLVPCFFVRREGYDYDLFMEEPIDCGVKGEAIEKPVEKYIQLLERYIQKYPEQWLWTGKRWKYTWTKRLLILSDGKPGHEKQSQAIVNHFRSIDAQYERSGMEYPCETIQVRFRSAIRKKLFSLIAPFYIPFAQGRLGFLKWFLEPSSYEKISRASADFVISAGSGLVPLNLCLARDFLAKSVVLMRPSFPFNLFEYDLSVVPAHDQGLTPRKALRPVLAPNPIQPTTLERDAEKLKTCLRDPSKIKISVFLGGDTRNFKISVESFGQLFETLQRLSKKYGDYLMTTSRRTPDEVVNRFREQVLKDPSCQLFVEAKKDTRPEVAGGMMALSEILMVTEDSVSMISEAISAGKKVIVLTFNTDQLPKKHQRFQMLLKDRAAVTVCSVDDLEKKMEALCGVSQTNFAQVESDMLRKRLQEIL